jgi:sulfite reductase (NADPH) flavoprotein alpha-component
MTAPARAALERAAAARAANANENLGFLSEEHGLLPVEPPPHELPPSHRAWDELAARLPELFRTVTGRELLDELPILPANEDALPDACLLRAASLLGHFAHTYVRVRPDPPERLPDSIVAPWTVVCRRLGREARALTYDDLVTYNWRLVDDADPRRCLENLAVLTPTVANREERIFYMAQVEIIARTAPTIGCMVRAQEAATAGDEGALGAELAQIIDTLGDATRSFLKIDPNPHSPTYVDPVVWAKTVAPFAVAISAEGAISGAAASPFQALDVFLGRRAYDSRVGREALRIRRRFAPNLREFIDALAAVPIHEHVAKGSPRLRGLWASLLEAYAGDHGFLSIHRRKAYAFLEVAFKVGRSVTTGGFSGLFEDQTWDVATRELEAARLERWEDGAVCPARARAEASGPLHDEKLAHVRLDVADVGLRFKPGDRLAIRPRNTPVLVERTLRALRAPGDATIRLDGRWRAETGAETLPLRELLEGGRIRPVERAVAKALLALSDSERLRRIVNARAEAAWELWDLVEVLAAEGLDPRTLWQSDPWEPYAIARLVPPIAPRLYSVASAMGDAVTADGVDLLASELRYAHAETDVTPGRERVGTASAYLRRLAGGSQGERVDVRVVPAVRFHLPDDPATPIVMFAGGAGVSPFRAFAYSRREELAAGETWLLLSTRSERQRDAIAADVDGVRFDAVLTHGRLDGARGRGITDVIAENADELRERALGDAVFYVCGSAGFASAVIDALEEVTSRAHVRTMIASGRLQQDVFTSGQPPAAAATQYDASEIVRRNDDGAGYWTVISGGVYDLTEFVHRHPGGAAILHEVAGRDGTHSYRQIEHHLDPEIEASLPMYRVGTVRRLDFGRGGTVAIGESGLTYVLLEDLFAAWVRYLYLVVEIQNAVRHDFGILDTVAVGDDDGGFTFLEAQLLVEAHRRFAEVYLAALLGADLQRLFALTAGFVAPDVDVRELSAALGAVPRQSHLAPTVEALRSLGPAGRDARERVLGDVARLRAPLQAADLALLDELKAGFAAGVALFERFGRETPTRAGRALLDPLRELPRLVSGLDDALAAAVDGRGDPGLAVWDDVNDLEGS